MTDEGRRPISPAGSLVDRIGISWRSAFRDVFLIVVSILIAFGLEAWWDGQRTLAEERAALSAVRDDLRAARLELDSVMLRNERVIAVARVVLTLSPTEIASLPPDSALQLTRGAYGGGLTFDPTTGALQGLLSAGTLSDIRNGRLAADLSAWPGLLDEIEEDQAFIIDSFNRLLELRVGTGTIESSLVHIGMLPGPAPLAEVEVLARLADGDANRGELLRHMMSVRGLQDELAEVDVRLDSMLEQLDAELGD